jgi:hypothetical protein
MGEWASGIFPHLAIADHSRRIGKDFIDSRLGRIATPGQGPAARNSIAKTSARDKTEFRGEFCHLGHYRWID